MTRTPILAAVLAASLAMGIAQAQTAAPKAAAAAPAAGKVLYPQAQFDTMLKQRIQQGQPDTPELRSAIREELNTRELLAREAKKQGLEKNTDVKNQMDLASQTVLVSAFVADWIKKNPISDADLRKDMFVAILATIYSVFLVFAGGTKFLTGGSCKSYTNGLNCPTSGTYSPAVTDPWAAKISAGTMTAPA